MSKYIIEVDDNPVGGLFKVKGFRFAFDQEGLDSLQKYEESVVEVKKEQPFVQSGDKYLFAVDNTVITYSVWCDDIDCRHMSIGNFFFHTKEETKFAVERLNVLTEMEKFVEPLDAKWDGNTCHYYIYYDTECKRPDICFHMSTRHNELYFESKEIAEECIKAVGVDRIKKYYFGIK